MLALKDNTFPKVSVITVVFNAKNYLEETIKSVARQNYNNLEYIVIDGGSTDGTIDTIRKYNKSINHWISDKDNGIYDAMNKGIKLARGEWIIFLNAGDYFYNQKTLNNLIPFLRGPNELFYGDHIIRYDNFDRIHKAKTIDKLWAGMPFNHQSMFCKANILKKYMFDISFKLASDYDLICKIKKNSHAIAKTDCLISSISVNGASDNNPETIKETWRISKKYFNKKIVINAFFLFLYGKNRLISRIKRSLPLSVFLALKKCYYKLG